MKQIITWAIIACMAALVAPRLFLAKAARPPSVAQADAPGGKITLLSDGRGHYVANAFINGVPVAMLVDTGATMIALSADDAAKVGLKASGDRGQALVSTANGMTTVRRVVLDRIQIGPVDMRNLDAVVMGRGGSPMGGSGPSLLGMNFLSRLSKYEVSGGAMVLQR